MRTPRMAAHCRFIITPPLLSPPWFDDDDEARGVYYALSFKSIHFSGKVIRPELLGASRVYNRLQVVP